ncbi:MULTISPECIES: hypothetical protein [unclassified Nocardioides]|uniref:hypothetical protein n=1 Tax=unclassified Nocardioides TaxID=2615069 RepID=UPI00116AB0F1|nr:MULTISPECIES: hypothetical protein [unclassified Nocardioides]TQK72593.1 hypothetical protein FBY23_4410 [Nocardioides sp. SLBN-35]WGY03202.1 hypothetical protein QI633_05450 [Nocardioides sp. QY071]
MFWLIAIPVVLAAAALWAWAARHGQQAAAIERAHEASKAEVSTWRAPHSGAPNMPG